MSETTPQSPPVERRLRLWPALAILGLQWVVVAAFWLLGSTNIHNAIALGLPAIGGILLLIWWLAASRAPWAHRIVGALLVLSALGVVVFTQANTLRGLLLLSYAVPVLFTGLVALMVLMFKASWRTRSAALTVYVAACVGLFGSVRLDSLAGNLVPVLSWRWTPTAQDLADALAHSDAHGTATLAAEAGPGDWPAFRGALRDGVLRGTKFAAWTTAPREVWRKKVGPGWSSFAAVGDYVFTQEQRGADEAVVCYKAATGEEVWVNRIPARFEDAMGLGPRATPSFADGKLYTQGGKGALQCLDASTGATVWSRDLTKDGETGVPGWGFVSSPLVVGDLVVEYTAGGEGKSVIAYKRATGDIVWRSGHSGGGYSSPHFADLEGVPQILMVGDWGMQSLALDTGAFLWDQAWRVKTNPRCCQPLLIGDGLVLYGTTGTMGSRLLRVKKQDAAWTVEQLWESNKYRPYFNDGSLHKGFLYGFDGDRLDCIDLTNGQRKWEGKRYDGQMLLIEDMDLILVVSEKGDVALVDAVPDRFNERVSFKALTGKTWNHPVIAHGRLFVRNSEEAVCYELGAP